MLAVWVALLPGAAAGEGAKEDRTRALGLFQEGNALLDRGDLEGALDRYRRARALHASYKIDLNLATTLFQLGRFVEAGAPYERFFREGARRSPAAIVSLARERFARVKALTARIELTCPVAGASVRVDGAAVGLTPLPLPIYLAPGEHTVEVEGVGRPPFRTARTLAAGETLRLEVPRPALPAPAGQPADAPHAAAPARATASAMATPDPGIARERRRKTLVGWSSLGAGGALLAGAAVLLGVGASRGATAHDDYHALASSAPAVDFEAARQEIDDAKGLVIGGGVLAGAAAIALGVAIHQLITRPEMPAESSAAGLAPVWLAPGPGLGITGRF